MRRNSNSRSAKFNAKSTKLKSNKFKDLKSGSFHSNQENYTNDVAWYTKLPEISKDITSNALFKWPIGKPYSMDYRITINGGDTWNPSPILTMPGVATIWTIPWFGTSTDQNSAINIAKVRLYSYMRKANSGSTNYDPEDLMIHIAAGTAICAKINECQRLYGLIMKYSSLNQYIPKSLFAAMGYDYNSFAANIANYRERLNIIISRMASTNIPAGISYFDREAFLYSGVYTEGETIKDQLYVFMPYAYPIFSLDADGAGQLIYKRTAAWKALNEAGDPNSGLASYEACLKELEDMINAFFDLNDFSVMNGDIAKAWGDNLMKFQLMHEAYDVPIQFDIKVLEQIKNATVMSDLVHYLDLDDFPALVQNKAKNSLLTVSTFSTGQLPIGEVFTKRFSQIILNAGNIPITAHAAQPDEEVQLENTRLAASVTHLYKSHVAGSDTSLAQYRINAGSDIVVMVTTYTMLANGSVSPSWFERAVVSYDGSLEELNTLFHLAELHSRFEFLPKFDLVVKPSATSATDAFNNYQVFNYSNFGIFSPDEMARIHQICLESLFYVS